MMTLPCPHWGQMLPARMMRRRGFGSAAGSSVLVFAALRDADALGADVILSEAVEAEGIGLAVMNRLGRAAAFHIVEV